MGESEPDVIGLTDRLKVLEGEMPEYLKTNFFNVSLDDKEPVHISKITLLNWLDGNSDYANKIISEGGGFYQEDGLIFNTESLVQTALKEFNAKNEGKHRIRSIDTFYYESEVDQGFNPLVFSIYKDGERNTPSGFLVFEKAPNTKAGVSFRIALDQESFTITNNTARQEILFEFYRHKGIGQRNNTAPPKKDTIASLADLEKIYSSVAQASYGESWFKMGKVEQAVEILEFALNEDIPWGFDPSTGIPDNWDDSEKAALVQMLKSRGY